MTLEYDETDGWIFSDEAHVWMDERRGSSIQHRHAGSYGKEYGLFGFKSDVLTQQMFYRGERGE